MTPLTLFQRIIQEHENQFFLKNYTEKMIGSIASPGLFIRQLKLSFGKAIQAQLWLPAPVQFTRAMIGRFGKRDKDTIHFLFSFRYDPTLVKLQLVELTATLNNKFQRIYPIHQPHRDLPPANNVHKDLVLVRDNTPKKTVQESIAQPRKQTVPSAGRRIAHH